VLNIISIKKCGGAMDKDLKPKVKVRGSSPHFYNLYMIPRPFGLG